MFTSDMGLGACFYPRGHGGFCTPRAHQDHQSDCYGLLLLAPHRRHYFRCLHSVCQHMCPCGRMLSVFTLFLIMLGSVLLTLGSGFVAWVRRGQNLKASGCSVDSGPTIGCSGGCVEGHRLLESHTLFSVHDDYYGSPTCSSSWSLPSTIGYQHMCSFGACFPSSRCFSSRSEVSS